MESNKKSLYIIDGYSLIYRSYFAFINRPLRDLEGNNVSALFGFFNTLLMLIREYNPTYLVVAMDTKEPTFRHTLYEPYKANRDAAPQDLHEQVPKIEAILEAANISRIGVDGWEADDVIASLIECATKQGIHSVMVTGDKDLLQLVNSEVSALRPPKKGESSYREVGPKEVFDEFGVHASQIVDYLALIGDSSDNVPGVAGIGPKGAVKLLQEYPTLDEIYENVDKLTPSVKKRLLESKEMAYLSKRLVTLDREVVEVQQFDSDLYTSKSINWDNAVALFEEANAKSLVAAVSGEKEQERETTENRVGLYHTITTLKELERVLSTIESKSLISFDFETTSVDEMEAEIVGFSFTNTPFEAWYVPLVAQSKRYFEWEEIKRVLKETFIEREIALVGQNLKYEYKLLKRFGLEGVKLHFDTMIAAWMLDSSSSLYNMDYLAQKYLDGYKTVQFNDVVPKGGTFDEVPLSEALHYAAEDADVTWRLYEVLDKELTNRGLKPLFSQLEMPLVKLLGDMELCGIGLDREKLDLFDKEVVKRIEEIENQIYDEVGHPFNINSTKQLQVVLFEERSLPPIKKIKSGYSTATETLEQLAHLDVVPHLILQNRGLVKLKNTYIDTLPSMINPHTKRVHTSYSQTGTATGRLSSRNPNLQNIPVRNEDGRRIREAFVAPEGSLFLSADYSQIELVILAHLADDKNLKQAFLEGQDIHTHTASLIFDVMPELVLAEQRRIAKTINFGVMYGMSAFRLSNELQISRKEAQDFINNYFHRFSKVKEFMHKVIEEAKESKRVKTILNRERLVPEITSRNRMEQSQAERIVVNTAIQGSAADIMKLAMLHIVSDLKRESFQSKLLLQVHDELIFEVPKGELEQVKAVVKEGMEGAYPLSIPLKVSMEVGSSWGQMG